MSVLLYYETIENAAFFNRKKFFQFHDLCMFSVNESCYEFGSFFVSNRTFYSVDNN